MSRHFVEVSLKPGDIRYVPMYPGESSGDNRDPCICRKISYDDESNTGTDLGIDYWAAHLPVQTNITCNWNHVESEF